MRIFYSTDFKGLYGIPVAAVIVAEDAEHARQLLEEKLQEQGLTGHRHDGDPPTLKKITTTKEQVLILNNGDY